VLLALVVVELLVELDHLDQPVPEPLLQCGAGDVPAVGGRVDVVAGASTGEQLCPGVGQPPPPWWVAM
jgi:hypothetical protein